MTSSAHDADLEGNNFRRTIQPQSFIAVAFIFSELDRGGFRTPPPRSRRSKKSPVWIGLSKITLFAVHISTSIMSQVTSTSYCISDLPINTFIPLYCNQLPLLLQNTSPYFSNQLTDMTLYRYTINSQHFTFHLETASSIL